MKIVLFEDLKYKNFYPISRMRTVGEIRTGRYTQKERAVVEFGDSILIHSEREGFGDDIEEGNDTLFLNARLKTFSGLKDIKYGSIVMNKDEIVAYRWDRIISKGDIEKLNITKQAFPLYDFIWDVIASLSDRLLNDIKDSPEMGKIESPPGDNIAITDPDKIYIGSNVRIENGVLLNSSKGPIYIDDDSVIRASTVIDGPVFIGKGCLIKPGSLIDTVSAGEITKLSGEIEGSILQGYVNKQHFGFLGHSFIGEWVNLGAGTTNSDLKNNYSNIRVYPKGKEYETGMQFLGLLMGDHCKTAINTSFNTGTIVEPFCNIFGREFSPKYLPPFSWCGDKIREYRLDKAMDTAKLVMKRRDVEMENRYEKRIIKLFNETKRLRNKEQ